MNQQRRELTYGRLMLILLALIVFAVGAAFVRQLFTGPTIGFDDVPFVLVQQAKYDRQQLDSPTLDRFKSVTAQSTGTLLWIKTNAGNFAKLSVSFQKCLIDPQNIKFWIHQGSVYDVQGRIVQRLDNFCVDLTQKFDLDSGQSQSQGAEEGSADVAFIYQGVGLQIAQAINGAASKLPLSEDLHVEEYAQ